MKRQKRLERVVPAVVGAFLMMIIQAVGVPYVAAGEHHNMNMSGGVEVDLVSPGTITEDMRCPVCGMYPASYPKWHSHIVFNDGSIEAFDGCKDLFTFLLDIKRFDSERSSGDVAAVFVKDFISGEWINAKEAYFVAGSSMTGPMGKELIPFSGHMEAMQFQKKHGGSMINYPEITMKTIMSLKTGGMKMRKHDGHMGDHGDH